MTCTARLVEHRDHPKEDPLVREHASTLADRADRVREAIESAGLTLYRVSSLTAARSGTPGPGLVTHTLYRDVRAGHTPNIHQLAALSRVTKRSLTWWLEAFGVPLQGLADSQMALHRHRTILLPSRTLDDAATVTVPEGWSPSRDTRRTQRMSDAVAGTRVLTVDAVDRAARRRFLYARVGALDPWLPAELVPGSLVRIDPARTAPPHFDRKRTICAVAYSGGLSCCYVDAVSPTHVALFGATEHAEPVVCRLGHEVTILGRVDAELRVLDGIAATTRARRGADRRPEVPVAVPDPRVDTFGTFLRKSRALIHLTLREAHALTDRVAARFDDERFRISLGALSNYETLESLPGSVHALYSLAAIYAIDFPSLLRTGGLSGEGSPPASGLPSTTPWVNDLLTLVQELPLFLGPVLGRALGHSRLDPSAIYLWGLGQKRLDPRLKGALAVVVDRRDRRLSAKARPHAPQPPLFMLRLANEAHICCSATLDGLRIIVHPAPTLGLGPRYIPREHVEVIGRVTAVLRTLRA